MIADFPEFRKLVPGMQEKLKYSFEKSQPEVSELSLGYLYGYNEYYKFELAKKDDSLLIFGLIDETPSFLLPAENKEYPYLAETALSYLHKNYGKGRIHAVNKYAAEIIKKSPGSENRDLIEDRDDADYVYSVKDLAELKGSKYHSKKNLLNQFTEKYNYEFLELDESMIEKCLVFQKKWCKVRTCDNEYSLAMENTLVQTLLRGFNKLGLFGGIILIDNECQAFTLAEKLNQNTCVVHVEKGNTEYKGIYQAINQLFCQNIQGKYKFVNREQDMGYAGLRKAKLSYHPHNLVAKFDLLQNK